MSFLNKMFLLLNIFFISITGKWEEIPKMSLKNASGYKIDKLAISDINNIWAEASFSRVSGVYKWEKNKWVGPLGKLDVPLKTLAAPDKLSVAQDNTIYALKIWLDTSEKLIYVLEDNKWKIVEKLDKNTFDLAVINKNDMWVTQKTSSLIKFSAFHWDGKKWEQKGNENIWEISIGNDGSVWGKQIINFVDGKEVDRIDIDKLTKDSKVDYKTNILKWDGKKWKSFIALEDEYIFNLAVVDKNNIWVIKGSSALELYPYKLDMRTKKWIKQGNIESSLVIAAGRDGTILMVDKDNKVYKWVEEQK